ncbi:MAG TPA: DUF6356 family protein [Micavibrio sp.]
MKQESLLTRHLRDANETYLQHLGFTLKVAATLMAIALVALTHGLLPFLFTHTASAMLASLTATMQARKAACETRQGSQSSDS